MEKHPKDVSFFEQFEESFYNSMILLGSGGFIACLLLIIHTLIFHAIFPFSFLIIGIVCLAVAFGFKWHKFNKFNERDGLALQRLKRLELKFEEIAA